GHLVRQRTPESWTGSAWLRQLALYGKVVCFDILSQFRGVHNRRHNDSPCPWLLPMRMGAASRGARHASTWRAASREGQSSPIIIGQRNYDAQRQKRKTNCFHHWQKNT